MTKRKESTFAQLMAAKDDEEKKYGIYCKASDKVAVLESRFPTCHNKLFRHNGKIYLVSCHEDSRDKSRLVYMEEVEE